MQVIRKQATEVILAKQPQARDAFVLCDVSELPGLIKKHCGHAASALDALNGKNEKLTALADKFMSQFENDVFAGRGWATRELGSRFASEYTGIARGRALRNATTDTHELAMSPR